MKQQIIINATGCVLVDRILRGVDFNSPSMRKYLSRVSGDGGLVPGELVLKEHLESFSGDSLVKILKNIYPFEPIIEKNVGGPAIIAMVCAAQMLEEEPVSLNFFQHRGDDHKGEYIVEQLRKYAPSVGIGNYTTIVGATPETTVLSDPDYNGVGERTFINTIGVGELFEPDLLEDVFLKGDILFWGGTALTPAIHKSLNSLFRRGHKNSAMNIVSTVFDFPNEYRSPGVRWPMGENISSYLMIDLLIADYVEALHLTGTENIDDAIERFRFWGLPALIVTNGAENVRFYASEESSFFGNCPVSSIPVVEYVTNLIKEGSVREGDTTGCGDNFVGGVLVSIAQQMIEGGGSFNLREAVVLGNTTGSSACFYSGGMLKEKEQGEKRKRVELILGKYREELESDALCKERRMNYERGVYWTGC